MIAAVIVVLILAAGGIAVAGSRNSATTNNRAAQPTTTLTTQTEAVSLPVKECPTTQGIQSTSSSAVPPTITVSLPSSLAKSVAYYSDSTRSIAPIMAPAGWSCSVMEAVDGGITLSVFPHSETATFARQTSSPQPFATSKAIAVVADSGGACQGCVLDIACPLISYVGTQTGETTPCPNTQPTGEVVKWLNGSPTMGSASVANDTVSFEDPPGVAGEGVPSGGPYPANGVFRYSYAGDGSASVVTCTLPASQHDLCKAILNDSNTRNWPSTGAATTTPTSSPAPTTTDVPTPTTAVPDPGGLATAILCTAMTNGSNLNDAAQQPVTVANPQSSAVTNCGTSSIASAPSVSSVDPSYVYVIAFLLDSSGQPASDSIARIVNVSTSSILAFGGTEGFCPSGGTGTVPSGVLASFGLSAC